MRKLVVILMLSSVGYMASCQNLNNSGSNSQTSGSQVKQTLSVADFEQKIATLPAAQLIDVRTPGEFTGGHLKNATNIDINDDAFESGLTKLDKSKPILVYCLSGGRSAKAANKMKDMGFKEIYNLDGGIMQWEAADKPVETGK
jgi:thioredoxin 1